MRRRATHIRSRRETREIRASRRARLVGAGLVAACLGLIMLEVYWALILATATGQ